MLQIISNTPRDYPWGSHTLLAELEGREAAAGPEAEVWFGDHPSSPAIDEDGRPLSESRSERLPYLLKLLAAGSPLSIQVHPSKAQAVAGYAAERGLAADDPTRNYIDDNHKPELVVAISEQYHALCGLRLLPDTLRYLDAFPDDAVGELRQRLAGADAAVALRHTIAWLLRGEATDTVAAITTALADVSSDEFAEELAAARRIAEVYPGDPGLVVAMLMNLVVLKPGEGVFLRAGLLHAYLSGLGVELMAASDNVLRGGLTGKRVDVAELLSVLDTTPAAPVILHAQPLEGADGVCTYGPGIADFALDVVELDAGVASLPLVGPAIILATAGVITVEADGTSRELRPGQAALADTPGPLRMTGSGRAFIATPGR